MKYESEILEVIHQDVIEIFKVGAITEARMREYDEMCLANPKTENKSSPVYTSDNSVNVENISHVFFLYSLSLDIRYLVWDFS